VVNIFEKQSNHKSKTYNRLTETKKKKKRENINIIQKKIIKPQKEKQKGNRETKKKYKINGKTQFKMAINMYLLIITLNVNELNAPIKK